MHVSAKLTCKTAHHTTPDRDHLVVEVSGDTDATLRPRLGIVAVIDRSGSMSMGRKLDVVKASLDHLTGYLGPDDSFAVVAFDDRVDTLLAPTVADEAGRSNARAAVARLTPRGGTAMHDGLARGLELAGRMAADLGPGAVVRVLLLTDGRANVGHTSTGAFAALVADTPAAVSVSAVGVGGDCDHDLLGSVAERGAGSYGFVETPADAARVLGAELGGLLNAVATDVTVAVTPRGRWTQPAAALGVPAARQQLDGGHVTVTLGTLLAGETRQVVVPVTLDGPGRSHARPVTIAQVTVTGSVDDRPVTVTVLPKVKFVAEPDAADVALVRHVDRAVLAQVQQDAEAAAGAGDFTTARGLLADVALTDPVAIAMRDAMVGRYADAVVFAASASFRRSATSVLSVGSSRLIGASGDFDALASRTYGSYTTDGQRDVASEVAASVSRSLSEVSSPQPDLTPGAGTAGGCVASGQAGWWLPPEPTSRPGVGLGDISDAQRWLGPQDTAADAGKASTTASVTVSVSRATSSTTVRWDPSPSAPPVDAGPDDDGAAGVPAAV